MFARSGQGRNIVRSISAMCSSRRDVGSKTSSGAIALPDRRDCVDQRDKDIARFHFHILRMLALRHCLRLFFGWIMLWATAAIVLRVAWQTEPRLLCWGLLGLAPAAAIGVALAVRQTPSPRAVRAALDRNGRLGGLLMAAGEEDIGQWGAQISRVPIPVVRWRSGRQWLLLLASIVFLAAVFLHQSLPAGPGRHCLADRRRNAKARREGAGAQARADRAAREGPGARKGPRSNSSGGARQGPCQDDGGHRPSGAIVQ